METKTFKTLAIASAVTGVALMDGMKFSDMQEIYDFVLGYPIWTHELGDRATGAKVEAAIRAQFPNMPSRDAAHADFKKAGVDALAAYGETITVTKGTGERTEGPLESLVRMTGRPEDIIVVKA